MADIYKVTGAAAVVRLTPRKAGEVYLYRDAVLPSNADPDHVAHLLDVGLITTVELPATVEPVVVAEPVKAFDEMTVDELRTYATEHEINLQGATRKEDIIAVLNTTR